MYAKIYLITAAILLSGLAHAQTTAPKAADKKKSATKSATAPVTTIAQATPAKTEAAAVPVEVKAEESASSTTQEVIKYMKEKFSASYHGEYYFVRRSAPNVDKDKEDIQDIKIMHNPTLIYKPTQNWQALATAEFKYSDVDGLNTTFPNKFFRSLFTLTRKNILTEKDNGIQLDAGIGRRQFNTGITQLTAYGNNRIFSTVSRGFGLHKGSLLVQYMNNDYKHPDRNTWDHALELLPTINFQITEKLTWLMNDDFVVYLPQQDNTDHDVMFSHEFNLAYINYQWTDKFGTYFQFKYNHNSDFNNDPDNDNNYTSDNFEYYIGASYSFTPKATLTGEIGSELFQARDGRDFFSEKPKFPELAFYLDLAF